MVARASVMNLSSYASWALGFADSPQELEKKFNKELTTYSQWFFGNKLLAHQLKTVYMIFFANKNTPPLSLYLKLDFQDRKSYPYCLSNMKPIWENVFIKTSLTYIVSLGTFLMAKYALFFQHKHLLDNKQKVPFLSEEGKQQSSVMSRTLQLQVNAANQSSLEHIAFTLSPKNAPWKLCC